MQEFERDNFIVERSVTLSLIEVFFGSFLHLFKIPMAGHFLSLNQGAYLTKVAHLKGSHVQKVKSVIHISTVVAMMKSLAPTAKKLGPMISISFQGLLYGLGILIFGTSLFGQIVAMILLSLWAFLQPFITFFILYGIDFASAVTFFLDKTVSVFNIEGHLLWYFVIGIVSFKLLLASIIPVYINFRGYQIFDRLELFLITFGNRKVYKQDVSPLKGTVKDLLRPSMIISVVMMYFFLRLNGVEQAILYWKLLRAMSLAFIIFYLSRSPWFLAFLTQLASRSKTFQKLHKTASIAFSELKTRL